jgi:hypothetical protein
MPLPVVLKHASLSVQSSACIQNMDDYANAARLSSGERLSVVSRQADSRCCRVKQAAVTLEAATHLCFCAMSTSRSIVAKSPTPSTPVSCLLAARDTVARCRLSRRAWTGQTVQMDICKQVWTKKRQLAGHTDHLMGRMLHTGPPLHTRQTVLCMPPPLQGGTPVSVCTWSKPQSGHQSRCDLLHTISCRTWTE